MTWCGCAMQREKYGFQMKWSKERESEEEKKNQQDVVVDGAVACQICMRMRGHEGDGGSWYGRSHVSAVRRKSSPRGGVWRNGSLLYFIFFIWFSLCCWNEFEFVYDSDFIWWRRRVDFWISLSSLLYFYNTSSLY